MRFLKCDDCDTILGAVGGNIDKIACCGSSIKELIPNTEEASVEKHLPVIELKGNLVSVSVGSVEHPMTEEHHIAWVAIETKQGFQRKNLNHTGTPFVEFAMVDGDELKAVYAYCNLHGLWLTKK